MDEDKSTKFISSLAECMQFLCNKYVEFDKSTVLTGQLFLSVDSGVKTKFIVNENVCTTEHNRVTYRSNSHPSVPSRGRQSGKKARSANSEFEIDNINGTQIEVTFGHHLGDDIDNDDDGDDEADNSVQNNSLPSDFSSPQHNKPEMKVDVFDSSSIKVENLLSDSERSQMEFRESTSMSDDSFLKSLTWGSSEDKDFTVAVKQGGCSDYLTFLFG